MLGYGHLIVCYLFLHIHLLYESIESSHQLTVGLAICLQTHTLCIFNTGEIRAQLSVCTSSSYDGIYCYQIIALKRHIKPYSIHIFSMYVFI